MGFKYLIFAVFAGSAAITVECSTFMGGNDKSSDIHNTLRNDFGTGGNLNKVDGNFNKIKGSLNDVKGDINSVYGK
jgi:hypothetical protein